MGFKGFYLDLYEFEKKKIEYSLNLDMINQLSDVLYLKLNNRSKSYIELETLLSKLQKKNNTLNSIIQKESDVKINISTMKIKTNTLNEIKLLNNDLKLEYIHEIIDYLIRYYKEHSIFKNLIPIENHQVPKYLKEKLVNSEFNICINPRNNKKIVYTIEDIIIKEDEEYLDISNFKNYGKDNCEIFLFFH